MIAIQQDDYLHGPEVRTDDSGPVPFQTVSTSTIGICGTAPDAEQNRFPLDTPVLIPVTESLQGVGSKGTLPRHLRAIRKMVKVPMVVVRVAQGKDEQETLANMVGKKVGGKYTGVQAFRTAESKAGKKPRLLIAPGYTQQRPNADGKGKVTAGKGIPVKNPVVAAMDEVAHSLKSIVIAESDAVEWKDIIDYRKDWDTKRVYIVHSPVGVYNPETNGIELEHQSAKTAARIALTDTQLGFWHSPSNKVVPGIAKLMRDVDWTISDKNCMANQLNANHITTFIRYDGSFKLWGNRVAVQNPKLMKYKFLNVVRTKDAIDETILKTHLYFIDMPMDGTFFETIVANVNAYFSKLKAKGAIIDGRCWKDEERNTPDALANGESYFTYEYTMKYPGERIIFTAKLTNKYLEEI